MASSDSMRAVAARVQAFMEGDEAAVLGPQAEAEAESLTRLVLNDLDATLPGVRILAVFHWYRYKVLPTADGGGDLSEALRMFNAVRQDGAIVPEEVQAALDGEYDHPRLLAFHAGAFLRRHLHSGDVDELDRALRCASAAVAALPADDPELHATLADLAAAASIRYRISRDRADLETAITAGRRAIETADHGNPAIAAYLSNLGEWLRARSEITGDRRDLDEAVDLGRRAVGTATPGDRNRTLFRAKLAQSYRVRFARTGDAKDLDRALSLLAADSAAAGDGPGRSEFLAYRAGAFAARYVHSGDRSDLDRAVGMYREAIATGSCADDLTAVRSELAAALWRRFSLTGRMEDLDESIAIHRQAVEATTLGGPSRAARLCDLANALWTRNNALGDRRALESALRLAREAVSATTVGDPGLPRHLSVLATVMRTCFTAGMPGVNIDDALDLARRAVESASPADRNWIGYCGNLIATLQERSARFGNDADRDEAIRIGREAVAAADPRHPDYGGILGSLGESLLFRYRRGGDSTDLDQAVRALHECIEATPTGHAQHALRLLNLQNALWSRYLLSDDASDLDRAVAAGRACIAATPPAHPERAMRLAALGTALLTRFRANMDSDDLDEAVAVNREAARIESSDRFQSAICRTDLGIALLARFDATGDEADLQESLTNHREAASLIPPDHPHQTEVLMGLANALTVRFEHDGDLAALHEAADAHRQAASVTTGNTANRIRAARSGARLLIQAARHESDAAGAGGTAAAPTAGCEAALPLLQNAVELLPLLVWPGLGREDQQHLLEVAARSAGADAAACAIAVGDDALAVQLLEQSRGVLWGQLLDLRSDLEALRLTHPDLAAGIDQCRSVLDRPGTPYTGLESAASSSDRIEAARRLAALLEEVRSLAPSPEFPRPQDFLRPPALESLLPPEGSGPVIVLNVSVLRCDALIVESDGVRSLALPFEHGEVFEQVEAYLQAIQVGEGSASAMSLEGATEAVLAWMWDAIASPVLGHLGYVGTGDVVKPRIWWCPTGPLTLLPVHAAGHHRAGDGRAAIEYAVPSYTPTLRALAESRRPTAPQGDPSLLVVAISQTPKKDGGISELRGARFERQLLEEHLGRDALTVLEDSAATHAAVTSGLREHRWVHMACHGTQNLTRPSAAGLVPYDWKRSGLIGIGDLTDPKSGGGDLAFLSACQTAIGGVTNLDEAVNLTAAMYYTGWRHVIGTLWTVADNAAPVIAATVYAKIIDEGRSNPSGSARALHEAVEILREADPAHTAGWARFIHMGP